MNKNGWSKTTKIFATAFLLVFLTGFVTMLMLIPFNYGHPLLDIDRLVSYASFLLMAVLFCSSLTVAGIVAILSMSLLVSAVLADPQIGDPPFYKYPFVFD